MAKTFGVEHRYALERKRHIPGVVVATAASLVPAMRLPCPSLRTWRALWTAKLDAAIVSHTAASVVVVVIETTRV